ncbi:ribosome maturation factor RimP [Streptacidiphilus fuscans]|uniref:Ribosome maturation factor RimP n=1 Tax=Streptacidiphilus fuscans TaxID=2789292 RepID=A0A931FJC7_9ACTN|nr:ribosome maturation factor RimP [Streptacidiphilus fuscans]MBF9073836.1 ribosome maturation factor RimP [Streptacidiphilus fuscans]
MSTTQNDRLHELLEPLAAKAGADLEEVRLGKVGGRRVLEVVVDADGGVDLDAVAELSRVFGEALDASDLMGDGEYRLEVGSPGVDRPLTQPRHWRRATTRLVKVQLTTGAEVTGRVLESDDEGVLLEIPPVKGRGKATERRLAFTEVAKARVQIEFNRKDSAADEDFVDEDAADVDGIDDAEDIDDTEDDASDEA